MEHLGRRTVLATLLVAPLAACGGMLGDPDDEEITRALQEAIEASPPYADGTLRFQHSVSRGTAIDGGLTLVATDEQALSSAFEDLLRRLSAAYQEQLPDDPAQVAVIARASADRTLTLAPEQVVTARDAGHPTTDDLAEHFGG